MNRRSLLIASRAALLGSIIWYFLYGPCGYISVKSSIEDMNTVSDGWQELRHATIPAFSLDGAVTYETIAVMNQWKTLAYQLKVPTCLTDARTTLVDAIELDYQTFQLAQNRIPIDQKLEYLTSNEAIFVRYQQEVDLIETCAPICNMGTNFTDFFEIFNWVNQFFP